MLKKLHESRESLCKQLQDILDGAKIENRAMNDNENAEFERIEGEIKSIDRTIAAEERARNIPAPAKKTHDGNEPTVEEVEERAFTDFILQRVSVENRAGEIQLTQGANGSIVPVTIAKRIITKVRDMVPFLQHADVVVTNGKLSVPVYGENATNYIKADYVDEGASAVDNVGKFTTVDLTGYVIGALALVSNKLKDNTDIDVVGFIVNQVAEAIAVKLENEFINGTDGKITGILSATNGFIAGSATAVTYDELVKLKHSLKQCFRANARWIMHPTTYTAICQLKDLHGLPYFKEEEYKILGLPVHESDSMPEIATGKKAIAVGDLTGYTIKATKSVEIKPLYEAFATKNMIGILAYAEYDGKITDQQKLAVLTMA